MKQKVPILVILFILVLWGSSCRKDFEFASSNGHLSFSKDTVYLDTVFKGIGSSTYSLKVYNTTKDDILIPSIKLRNGADSQYRLNVDGKAGKYFEDIPLYAEDSLFIFIETNVTLFPDNTSQLIYTDAIQFDNDIYLQEVELVTLAKDAIFLYPKNDSNGTKEKIMLYTREDGTEVWVESFELTDDQLHFNNNKPYVIYGYAAIPESQKLTIDAGARIHFHNGSGILVRPTASLEVNGTHSIDQDLLEGEVIFEGDRLEPAFSNTPGQWGTIFITKGSISNSIDHLTIKNAEIGIYVEGNIEIEDSSLDIANSQIHNSSLFNLWAKSATIKAKNILLGNAGSSSLKCDLGGKYEFIHATISNYWTNGFRTGRALSLRNYEDSDVNLGVDLLQADFRNSIIDGNSMSELTLSSNGENIFNYSFENCFIKFNKSGPASPDDSFYNFEGPNFINCILNGDPDYFNTRANDFRIGLDSDVINKGSIPIAQQVPFDLLNRERISSPDLGVYEATAKEE
ncbi:hypothetical protein [Maribacter cobaltidurans]|uniref:hypothetical protein n=1 Tax=Maribacter cobaltidurans TaxID=1178778 RepID=UPI001F289983|nr:hypothetical protein [Maribacter cobaltidurans]